MKGEPIRDKAGASARLPLRVLILGDSEEDALPLLRELERGGYEPTYKRVESPEDMRLALMGEGKTWDVVLCERQTAYFSAGEALEILWGAGSQAPFIVVSGEVGEEGAADAIRAGAADYVTGDNLKRLCPAVERSLKEAEARRMLEERIGALSRMAASLTVDQPMRETLNSLATGLVEASAAVACGVGLIDEKTELVRLVGVHDLSEEWAQALQSSWQAGAGTNSPILRAFHDHEPRLVHDIRRFILSEPVYAPAHPLARETPWDTVFFAPLVYRGRASGVIVVCYEADHGPTEDEVTFLEAVADQAAVAVENARLYGEAREKASLEERQRLSRELHDSVSQALYGISLGSKTARTFLDQDPSRAVEPLDYVLSLSEAGLSEMRALIFELRPESLEKEGLASALEKLATALGARHRIPIHTTLGEEPNVSVEAKENAYRIAREALHNTVKHARASRVDLKLECGAEYTVLEVRDDGVGFDPRESFPGHLGLDSMRERATSLGGRLDVESTPGEGTRTRVQIPLR